MLDKHFSLGSKPLPQLGIILVVRLTITNRERPELVKCVQPNLQVLLLDPRFGVKNSSGGTGEYLVGKPVVNRFPVVTVGIILTLKYIFNYFIVTSSCLCYSAFSTDFELE